MPAPPATVLRAARLDGRTVDVLLRDGVVEAIAPDLVAPSGAELVDLDGRWLLPGMWDNHVHLDEYALNRVRLDVSGATSAAAAADLVVERLRTDPPAGTAPLVGSGFRDALWPDVPTLDLLDRAGGDVPVVLVSADLHCCWVNRAAARRFGHDGDDGVVRETAGQALREELGRLARAAVDRRAATVLAEAAARGTVGIVDFQEPWQLDTWAARFAAAPGALRVVASVWPSHLDDPVARGLRTGDVVPGTGGLLTMGPLKVLTDGSLNTRTAYCHDPYPGVAADAPHPCGMLLVPPDELAPLLRRATAAGIEVALHAIGDRANGLVLDAFAATGATGRIEHAQLLSDHDVARFAALGVVASVQPEHAVDDRDVADRHWAGRTHRAFAYRSLVDAGAVLALGSDAPVAPLDPWITLAAAVHRSGDDRPSWHPEQEIPVDVALAASAGPDGPVAVGRRADLVVTELDPRTAAPSALRAMPVAGTLLGGRWTHRRGV